MLRFRNLFVDYSNYKVECILIDDSSMQQVRIKTNVNFKDIFEEALKNMLDESKTEYTELEIKQATNTILQNVYIEEDEMLLKMPMQDLFICHLNTLFEQFMRLNMTIDYNDNLYVPALVIGLNHELSSIIKLLFMNHRIGVLGFYSGIMNKKMQFDLEDFEIKIKPSNRFKANNDGIYIYKSDKVLDISIKNKNLGGTENG